jgi:hypothetical protein
VFLPVEVSGQIISFQRADANKLSITSSVLDLFFGSLCNGSGLGSLMGSAREERRDTEGVYLEWGTTIHFERVLRGSNPGPLDGVRGVATASKWGNRIPTRSNPHFERRIYLERSGLTGIPSARSDGLVPDTKLLDHPKPLSHLLNVYTPVFVDTGMLACVPDS